MAIKAKVFTYSAGWGYLYSKSEELEAALNSFSREHKLDEKQITNVLQSESEGKLITITFLYKEASEEEPYKTEEHCCIKCNTKNQTGDVCSVCGADLA